MTARWIDVPYKCRCMSQEAIIPVSERKPAEDIIDFMKRVQAAVGRDHFNRSPMCRRTKMEYLKIPVPPGGEIGGGEGGTA